MCDTAAEERHQEKTHSFNHRPLLTAIPFQKASAPPQEKSEKKAVNPGNKRKYK